MSPLLFVCPVCDGEFNYYPFNRYGVDSAARALYVIDQFRDHVAKHTDSVPVVPVVLDADAIWKALLRLKNERGGGSLGLS